MYSWPNWVTFGYFLSPGEVGGVALINTFGRGCAKCKSFFPMANLVLTALAQTNTTLKKSGWGKINKDIDKRFSTQTMPVILKITPVTC